MTLKRKTVKNIGLITGLKIFARIFATITLIILARLLTPSDFGIVAIATVFISLMDRFTDLGVSSAVIQKKGDIENLLKTGFTIRFTLSFFLFILTFLAAPLWGNFYGDKAITQVVRVISIMLVIDSFKFFPTTKLVKRLDFKLVAFAELIGRISYSLVAIILALSGFSYWSIVYGRIVQAIIEPVILFIYSPWKLSLSFDVAIARELFGFGKYVFYAGFMGFIIVNLDNAVIGKVIGMSALGYYSIAYRWATLTTSELSRITSQVMFPTYSSINTDLVKLKRAYLNTLKYTSMLSVPAAFGVLAVAPEFVITVLGEKWAPAILPLRILCVLSLVGAFSVSNGGLYLSIGKPKIPAYLNLIRLSALVIFIVPIAKLYGIVGVALLLSIVSMVIFPISLTLISRLLSIRKKQFMDILFAPTFSSIIMVVLVLVLKTYVKTVFPGVLTFSWAYLISLVVFAVVIYFISLFIFTKGRLKEDILTITSNLAAK